MNTTTTKQGQESQTKLSELDRSRIIHRMVKDHQMTKARAEVVFVQTVQFLEMCASHDEERFVPSEEVDKGWHTFLLYTKAYHTFCGNVGRGEFIDHEPSDIPGRTEHGGYVRTIRFMETHGIVFNRSVWPKRIRSAADCSPDPCTCTGDADNKAV